MNKLNIKKQRIVLFSILMLVIMLFLAVFSVSAAVFIDDDDSYIGEDEVIDDDVFISGETVTIDGTINGILFATGGTVEINGTINDDVFLGGESIVISDDAVIEGNLFFGGQRIQIDTEISGSVFGGGAAAVLGNGAVVGRNMYYGGFSLVVEEGAEIGKDLYGGGYQFVLDGDVERDINISAGAVEISGNIGRDVAVEVASPEDETDFTFFNFFMQSGMPEPITPGIRVSEDASIGGSLTYTSDVQQSNAIEAQPGADVYYFTPVPDETEEPIERPVEEIEGSRFVSTIVRKVISVVRNLVTLLILGGLALWLLPSVFKGTVEQAKAKPAPSAGWGFVVTIVVYVGSALIGIVIFLVGLLLGIVTLGGLSGTVFAVGFSSLALVMAVFSLLVIYGSKLVVVFIAGEWIMNQIASEAKGKHIWAMVIGVVIYVVLRAVPFFGWLIGLILTIIGIGAMWLYYRTWRSGELGMSESAALPEGETQVVDDPGDEKPM